MERFQRDRIYSLIVGKGSDAVEITNLQIKFDVLKTNNNKDSKNTATIEIYNLSEDRRRRLEEQYVQVSLAVGYAGTGLVNLFRGQVVNISSGRIKPFLSKKVGADIVTKLEIDEFYEDLNGKVVSRFVPAGRTVRNAIQDLIKEMPEVTRVEISGRNVNKTLPDGYPMSGSPKQILNDLSDTYGVVWQIDQTVLYVTDRNGSFTESLVGVPLISQMTGLIDTPEFINEEAKRLRRQVKGKKSPNTQEKKNALKFKILMNPSIVAGSTIKVEHGDLTGYYIVSEARFRGDFRGNDWYTEIRCEERLM